ncbi:hypothetical protein [Hymenobacter sp. B81]|uniref:hypothetical protein n=1 Tax=Hymenobacter sp. B81 TaxID=3344878 RepID=UPI0037DDD77C
MQSTLFVLGLLLTLAGPAAQAQTAAADSSLLAAAVQQARGQYARTVRNESYLYSGSEYVNYHESYVAGHQFFLSTEDSPGVVDYDGAVYAVPLRYDMRLDQVVLKYPGVNLYLKLVPEKVRRFAVHNHTFVRLAADTLAGSPIKTGFYDLLHEGRVQLLARRVKYLQTKTTPDGPTGEYQLVTEFYARQGGGYRALSGKKAVLELFPARKAELQKFIRDNQLKFNKKTKEAAIVALVKYGDAL